MIAEKGNWIGVLSEWSSMVVHSGIKGIRSSESGQTNFSFVTKTTP